MADWAPKKKLGFGLMRLPKEGGKIVVDKTCGLVDSFLKKGFTYFDTAYVYEGSEAAFKTCVSSRHPHSSYTVANKLPGWFLSDTKSPEDLFNESLERCGVDYFDFYLLHAIDRHKLETYEKHHCFEFGQRMKAEGKIKHFGFSFHDTADVLNRILIAHPEVEFVQLQINYLDWDDPEIQSRENYEVCLRHKVPVIIMEPVKGGTLADIPEKAREIFKEVSPQYTPAQMAIRYDASLKNVPVILSGMNTQQQLDENEIAVDDENHLTRQEMNAIGEAIVAIKSLPTIGCTACRYCCDGCPKKINIPEIFKCLNEVASGVDIKIAREHYKKLIESGESAPASACIRCHQCERHCPQHLKIISLLQKASQLFD